MYKKNYVISYDKLNGNFATITKMLDIAQQTSISQTESTSKNVEWYFKNKQGWLFLNWNVEIKKYPKYGQEVICSTVPVKFRKFLGQRDFRIEDLEGNVLMNASIKTSLIDLKDKRPIEPPEEMLAEYGENHEGFITNKFRMPKVEKDKSFQLVSKSSLTVKRLDTDTNKHTNNIKYMEWAENEIPTEIYEKAITKAQVVYKKETVEGDNLVIETYFNKNECVIVIFKKESIVCCEIMFSL